MASVPPPANSASSHEQGRKENIVKAKSILRGTALSPKEAYALAQALKKDNEFGLARKLLGRIRAKNDYSDLPEDKGPVKVGQQHALCTYKDPDLAAADRFQRALEILDEVDRLKKTKGLEIAEEQESLGLRGAVYKRWWQVGGQRGHLEQALGCYMRGFERGAQHDFGYTGINAALVLDFLAREDAGHAASDAQKDLVREQSSRARSIRRQLTQLLPTLPPAKVGEQDEERKKLAWLRETWWFYATIAEAHFGLGEYDRAIEALREFNAELALGHQGPPVEKIAPWEFESTITQLRVLADLQADLAERPFCRVSGDDREAKQLRKDARTALRGYLGELAPGLDRTFTGKVGLGLSGGGFRASLFHIGVLAHLAERDVLRLVEVLSCVSGGSIVGAHYYLEVKRLLEEKAEQDITREDYVELVAKLERDFLAGVETNIRAQVFSSVWANLRAFLQPGYTTTRRLGSLYETVLYSRVQDGRGKAPRYLRDLFVQPKGEPVTFKPKYDNWHRTAKVPMLVLNATTLNTGHNWQFTASWMGEPPSSLDSEIDANYRLRRMYHSDAPRLRDRWRTGLLARLFAPPDYQQMRLGDAVAASSSVPGLFEPLILPDLYEGKTVSLVDGGVYDNQGVASLLEQDCNVMLVSDASGQMAALDQPSSSRLGVPLRSFSVSMARVRQSQFQELDARRSSGLLKGLLFVHLKKDLDVDPVDWRECQDPHKASDDARPADRCEVLTGYGMQKDVQRLLAGIRTDLDSFTEVEAFALMTSGYRMTEMELRKLEGFDEAKPPNVPWRFLEIAPALEPGHGYDQLTRQLQVASKTAGKVVLLWRPLTGVAIALALAAAAGVALWLIGAEERTLVTLHGLRSFALVTLVALLVPTLVRVVRYRQTFRNLGLRALGGALLALGFKVHLLLFDPLFIRLGRVRRLLAMRK